MSASCVELEGWRYVSIWSPVNDIMSAIAGHKTAEFHVYDEVLSCCGLNIPCYALILPFWNTSIYSVLFYVGSM